MLDSHFLFAGIAMYGASIVAKRLDLFLIGDFLHRDRLAVHTNQRKAITYLELSDFPLGCGVAVSFRFERTFAWRRG